MIGYRKHPTFELEDGRVVPVLARITDYHDDYYEAFVLFVEGDVEGQYHVRWSENDGWRTERHHYPHWAFAYLAALVHALDNDEVLRHRDDVFLAAGVFVEAAVDHTACEET